MKRKPAAFMSYAHIDDKYGLLTEFRERLSHEVRVQTGEEVPIFQDRKDIQWGQTWKARIEGALYEVTFLIPIITPSFFKLMVRSFLRRFRRIGAEPGVDVEWEVEQCQDTQL